ncbi:MAG: diacylglycerol/polyprenol kinase family protein [Promethearchaeota archaeon]|jgi:dolichol kinase
MVFNPLGSSLSVVWDLIAMLISLILVMLVVQINAVIQKSGKLDQVITRKIVHIFAGPVYCISWLFFSGTIFSRFIALIVPGFFILTFVMIGTGRMKNENMVKSMSRTGDPKELLGGTLHYAIIMVIFTILWFYYPANPSGLIIVGVLAGGDGIADIVGRKYGGEKKFGLGGSQKTLKGTLGMFIGSVLTSLILVLIFLIERPEFNLAMLILPILIISAVCTVVEALAPKGHDNWMIFVSAIIMILILWLVVPVLWPYSFFSF